MGGRWEVSGLILAGVGGVAREEILKNYNSEMEPQVLSRIIRGDDSPLAHHRHNLMGVVRPTV